MKKLVILWVGIVGFGLCMTVTLALNVYAQQGGTQNIRMMAQHRALGQQRQALQQKMQGYRQQGQQLHYSMGGNGNIRMTNPRPPRATNRLHFDRKPKFKYLIDRNV